MTRTKLKALRTMLGGPQPKQGGGGRAQQGCLCQC